jgi:hypothetical protein
MTQVLEHLPSKLCPDLKPQYCQKKQNKTKPKPKAVTLFSAHLMKPTYTAIPSTSFPNYLVFSYITIRRIFE